MHKIYERFRESVRQFSAQTAVIGTEQNYTYQQLLEAVDKKADALQAQAISEKDVVAVYMNRSESLLITILALLKIGAVYVPVSTGYPEERLEKIIKTAGCNYLITENNVSVQELQPAIYEETAYILFTSGSTGTPKGVVTKETALLAELDSCQQKIQFHAGERVLFKTAVNFAFSIYEIFWPLFNGGCVVIVKEKEEKDIALLASYMRENRVAVLPTVPSVLQALMEQTDAESVFTKCPDDTVWWRSTFQNSFRCISESFFSTAL